MADRYQTIAGTPLGKVIVKRLGLPDPPRLRRYADGDTPLRGSFLIGGTGRAREAAESAIEAAGGDVATQPQDDVRYAGLVFDATDLTTSSELVALTRFFTPLLRSLEQCPHVVVFGATPAAAEPAAAQIAQRALEGFTRSLAKEIGHGGTVQLVYVAPGSEDRIASTLTFLLSPKSAYVSGQVVRIGAAVADDEEPADPVRPLTGRFAIVTGAARGIGAAIAQVLHRDGAHVVGVDVPQAASDLEELMDELGGDSILLDITAVDAPQRIARSVTELNGGVDVVVHNAGITRDKRLANMTEDRWTSVIDVNLTAPERITSELLDRRLIRPNGRVIGVASIAGIAGNNGQTNYATSKAGVIGLVEAMAPIAAAHGVTVNAVAPGFIETQMTAKVPVVLREAGRRMNSLSQGGLPIDVAEAVAWYADPRSSGVTGNVVRVCGQSLLGA
jgi:3-oxoacyl-[acyl-carrier protein] reductase